MQKMRPRKFKWPLWSHTTVTVLATSWQSRLLFIFVAVVIDSVCSKMWGVTAIRGTGRGEDHRLRTRVGTSWQGLVLFCKMRRQVRSFLSHFFPPSRMLLSVLWISATAFLPQNNHKVSNWTNRFIIHVYYICIIYIINTCILGGYMYV